MAPKTVKSWTVICDLIDFLVQYCELLESTPIDEEHKTRRTFSLDTPQKKADAIITILFGEETVGKRRGNPGFREKDQELVYQMRAEMKATGKTREDVIDDYAENAEKRKDDFQHDSIRERLISVDQRLPKNNPADYDYGKDAGLGFEDMYDDELSLVREWLATYKKKERPS